MIYAKENNNRMREKRNTLSKQASNPNGEHKVLSVHWLCAQNECVCLCLCVQVYAVVHFGTSSILFAYSMQHTFHIFNATVSAVSLACNISRR